jgi:hypothetical protein
LAAPFPTALPLPDGPPLVELLVAETVLEPMFKFPAVLLFFFFSFDSNERAKIQTKIPKQKSVQKRNQKIEKKKIISSASHKDGRPSLYSRVLSSKTTAREITCTNILA